MIRQRRQLILRRRLLRRAASENAAIFRSQLIFSAPALLPDDAIIFTPSRRCRRQPG